MSAGLACHCKFLRVSIIRESMGRSTVFIGGTSFLILAVMNAD